MLCIQSSTYWRAKLSDICAEYELSVQDRCTMCGAPVSDGSVPRGRETVVLAMLIVMHRARFFILTLSNDHCPSLCFHISTDLWNNLRNQVQKSHQWPWSGRSLSSTEMSPEADWSTSIRPLQQNNWSRWLLRSNEISIYLREGLEFVSSHICLKLQPDCCWDVLKLLITQGTIWYLDSYIVLSMQEGYILQTEVRKLGLPLLPEKFYTLYLLHEKASSPCHEVSSLGLVSWKLSYLLNKSSFHPIWCKLLQNKVYFRQESKENWHLETSIHSRQLSNFQFSKKKPKSSPAPCYVCPDPTRMQECDSDALRPQIICQRLGHGIKCCLGWPVGICTTTSIVCHRAHLHISISTSPGWTIELWQHIIGSKRHDQGSLRNFLRGCAVPALCSANIHAYDSCGS